MDGKRLLKEARRLEASGVKFGLIQRGEQKVKVIELLEQKIIVLIVFR